MTKISIFFLLLLCSSVYLHPDLDDFNNKRRQYAKTNNIANMWKLEYDRNDEIKMKNTGFDTELCMKLYELQVNHGKRYFFIPYDRESNDYDNKIHQDAPRVDRRQYDAFNAGTMEAMMPTQRYLSCKTVNQCRAPIGFTGYAPISIFGGAPPEKYNYAYFNHPCLVGPINRFSTAYDAIVRGPAGSQCGALGGVNDDGLCVPAPPVPPPQPPQPPGQGQERRTLDWKDLNQEGRMGMGNDPSISNGEVDNGSGVLGLFMIPIFIMMMITKFSEAYNAIVKGPPGSQCEALGGINDDGLCEPAPPTDEPQTERPVIVGKDEYYSGSGVLRFFMVPVIIMMMLMM
ncbi:unnamed protein product [Caenorhabditis nigoni]